jgi:hypothetical protein
LTSGLKEERNTLRSYPPELSFLMECLRARLHRRPLFLPAGVDIGKLEWHYFLSLVQHHRVTSQVTEALSGDCPEAVPARVQEELHARRRAHSRRALALTSELIHLAELFRHEEVEFMPFKGPLLSLLLYGDVAYRTYADLDVLVFAKDIEKAERILSECGYRPSAKAAPLEGSRLHLFRKCNNQLAFFKPRADTGKRKGNYKLEIHWRLLARCWGGEEWKSPGIFERAQTMRMGGQELRTLDDCDLLRFLCVHGAIHAWRRLFWLYDSSEIFRRMSEEDWNAALDSARQHETQRQLVLAAKLSHYLLETAVPEAVLDAFYRDSASTLLWNHVMDTLVCGVETRPPVPHRIRRFVYLEVLTAGTAGSVNHFVRVSNAPVDWQTLRLPEWLYFLYYPLRPALWLNRELRSRRARAVGSKAERS